MEREDYGMSCGIPLSTLDYSTTTDADKNGGHRVEPSLHPRETTTTTNDKRCRQNEAVELGMPERADWRKPSSKYYYELLLAAEECRTLAIVRGVES